METESIGRARASLLREKRMEIFQNEKAKNVLRRQLRMVDGAIESHLRSLRALSAFGLGGNVDEGHESKALLREAEGKEMDEGADDLTRGVASMQLCLAHRAQCYHRLADAYALKAQLASEVSPSLH